MKHMTVPERLKKSVGGGEKTQQKHGSQQV